jgi:hypothetical protein
MWKGIGQRIALLLTFRVKMEIIFHPVRNLDRFPACLHCGVEFHSQNITEQATIKELNAHILQSMRKRKHKDL